MTGLLLFGVVFAAAAASFVRPVSRWTTAWSRLSSLCVRSESSVGLYDSWRQAKAKTTGLLPTSQPQKGSVWPSLRQHDGLPAHYRAYGRTAISDDVLAFVCDQFAHHTGREWTARRLSRSRWVSIAQAPPLPAPDMLPAMVLPAWCLPVGVARSGHVWWDTRVDAHMLVVARTRWGKTTWARWLVGYAQRSSFWQVVWVDPETQDPATMLWRLGPVMREFAKRAPDDDPDRPRILVIVDEFPKVVRIPAKHAADYATRREIAEAVDQLLDRGGKRGIDLLDLTVDPRATAIGGHVRSSHGARLAAWLDDDEYRITLGRAVPNARKGPRGVGWWLAEGGFPEEVQVYAGSWPEAETKGPSPTTAQRIIPALGARKRR